jgi:hypothetical protein
MSVRAVALLCCALVACASAPATTAPKTEIAAPPPPPPERRSPPPEAPVVMLADRIVKAQIALGGADVTPTFAPVRADLVSGDDQRVASALSVVEEIGAQIARARREPSQEKSLHKGIDALDRLVAHVLTALVDLRRTAPCQSVMAVERSVARFNRSLRTGNAVPAQPGPDASGDDALEFLPKRVLVCAMTSIKDKVAACFARFQVPGVVIVNVVVSRQGSVTAATVSGQFAGTPTGDCVAGAAKTATFPPSNGMIFPYPFLLK